MTKPSAPTKAELHEMLAEAVRNTQPQPVSNAQPAPKPKRNTEPAPERDTRPRKTRPAPKLTAKTKSVRASGRSKARPR